MLFPSMVSNVKKEKKKDFTFIQLIGVQLWIWRNGKCVNFGQNGGEMREEKDGFACCSIRAAIPHLEHNF